MGRSLRLKRLSGMFGYVRNENTKQRADRQEKFETGAKLIEPALTFCKPAPAFWALPQESEIPPTAVGGLFRSDLH